MSRSNVHADEARGVLCVEDDEDARALLVLLFSRRGYAVSSSACLAEALDLLESHGFALILADYNLPDGTGTDLFREATRRGLVNDTVLYLVTAQQYPVRDEGVGLVHKPAALDELLEIAARAGVASS